MSGGAPAEVWSSPAFQGWGSDVSAITSVLESAAETTAAGGVRNMPSRQALQAKEISHQESGPRTNTPAHQELMPISHKDPRRTGLEGVANRKRLWTSPGCLDSNPVSTTF